MKYAQLIMGLLIGTALGGAVVASQGAPGGASDDHIREIVRDTIQNNGELLITSIQKYQSDKQNADISAASEMLKDPATHDAIFNNDTLAYAGNPKGTHLVAEFFDYNCPVCHMQLKVFQDLLKKDSDLKIIFHEFPIFGPESDMNSKIGFAVQKYYPAKYFDFYQKMMSGRGHDLNAQKVQGYLKELGFDVAKINAYAKSSDADAQLSKAQELAQKLKLQGTPSLVVGDALIPHAIEASELESRISGGAQ